MDDYIRVRRMHHEDRLSIREIRRRTGFHRKTIRKMLSEGSPPERLVPLRRARPKLGPFLEWVEGVLGSDRKVPRKQRHTAWRIYERLRDERGYGGGYTQVKSYVREARRILEREAYVPLAFEPGTAQVDWGEATAWVEGSLSKLWLFVMTLPWSDARFAAAFPRGTAEFFYEGHRRAFEHFGGVPRVVIYDNLRTAVTQVLHGRGRRLNTAFERFAGHYLFEARFCNPARGNEKGHVEGGVRWTRQRFFVPRPKVSEGWEAFNADLARRVTATYAHRCRGQRETVAERLALERPHLLPLPGRTPPMFSPAAVTASSLSLVRFETNDYSVPVRWAHHRLTLKPGLDTLEVSHLDTPVASHRRCYGRERAVYEPWHYLALIERKPGSLDDAAPLKGLELDPCFAVLRRRLEADHNDGGGTRAYIAVLRHLESHSLEALTRAVRRALELGVHDAEAVRHLLLCPPERVPGPLDLQGRPSLAAFHFAPPPLSGYAALGAGGS